MCTAYELGKRGGSFPDHLKAEAVDVLLGISGVHLIRRTIPAPVIVAFNLHDSTPPRYLVSYVH